MTYSPVVSTLCEHCPFRQDRPGYLDRLGAQDIAEALERGESFPCHKTVDYNESSDGDITPDTRHCAGAALVLEAENKPNQLIQVAKRLNVWTKPKGGDIVFTSLEDFIQHHNRY